jgi:benzoyl-CoA 2,3-dioxygenase component B
VVGRHGPDGSHNFDVYLRTAVSVDPQGWAQFGYVKMPDYRWGIFLNPAEQDRKIHFGDHKGEAAWQDVPGEHRANLRRIIVTQGDTEPASVEQQRHLGLTAPSQYDLRNLFQVNVEEGRHLWAMVYLLHKHFGRDGREEGEALLERRSGERTTRASWGLQREDAGLAVVLHVHLLHRPRRQVPAVRAGREQLRSAGAHHRSC